MNGKTLLDTIIVLLGIVAMYTPWLQLAKSERLTGSELDKKYPEYAGISSKFTMLYIGWVIILFGIFFYILLNVRAQLISVLSGLYASMGLFIGLFAVTTHVCPAPTTVPWLQYAVGEKAKQAGWFQVAWSLSVIIIAITIAVLRR